MRKLLCILLATLSTLALASCSLKGLDKGPTDGIIYDKSPDGTYVDVVGYTGTAKNIIIADTYEGLPVTNIGKESFNDSSIKSVVIPDSVTSIGREAFYNCDNLTSVVIPDSVVNIGDYAFCGCNKLANVVISDRVTSIGNGAFQACSALTSLVIGDSVESIGMGAFRQCRSLSS